MIFVAPSPDEAAVELTSLRGKLNEIGSKVMGQGR
jgi:hypothetical protein